MTQLSLTQFHFNAMAFMCKYQQVHTTVDDNNLLNRDIRVMWFIGDYHISPAHILLGLG